MKPSDVDLITRALGPVMQDVAAKAVAEATTALLKQNAALELRILELETRPAVVGPVGPPGAKGEAGAGIASLVVTADNRWLAHFTDGRSVDAGPVPKGEKGNAGERGEAGPSGLQGLPGPIGERGEKGDPGIPGLPGLPGLDGKGGAPGLNGKDGRDGVDGKDGASGLNGKDGAPGDRGPQGEKGLDGIHGRDGRDGSPGLPGVAGEKGIDGRDGRDGIDGKDGMDGLAFTDADLQLDQNRGWIFRLGSGDDVKDFPIPLPFFKGNWEAGTTYPEGAGVRWDGHYWMALKQTHEQPGEGSQDWWIVVSRGKQGREGKQGKDGAAGRDLTQMDPATGRKW